MTIETEDSNKSIVPPLVPPLFRFLTELTTWLWYLIAAFTINLLYILGFIISAFVLAVFNFPGDKNQKGPVEVSGYVRISIEVFSGLLGILGAGILFNSGGLLFQFSLTLAAFVLDFERWSWMLGIRTEAPESVTRTHRAK